MASAPTAAASTGHSSEACIMSGDPDHQQAQAQVARQRKPPGGASSSKPPSSTNGDLVGGGQGSATATSEDKVFCERRHSSDGDHHSSSSSHNTANSSSSSSSGAGGKCALQLWSRKALLRRKDIPKHLQFNPYIETGYRPLLDAWGCVMSLFYFHNETINILTHGVPMLYIFLMWRELLPWSDINLPILPWTHMISTVSPWVGSTIYHLFMNHRAGEHCYKSLLHLDMFGIWITQSFGALTTVYASVSCLSTPWIWRTLAVYCVISLFCLYKASHARNPWERRFCFTLPFLMRAAAVSLRVTSMGGGHPQALYHCLMQDLMAVVGGFIGALRIPEKWIPGRLDLLFNSHHIMHVVVVYAVYHLHQGAILDMVWLSGNYTCANSTTSL